MTILHVIKYDVNDAVRRWLDTADSWRDIFPPALAEAVIDKRKTGFDHARMVKEVREVLLEYEGPL